MPARYTAMFYIGVYTPGTIYRHTDTRLFIGTRAEAMEELREEVKTLFPDDYDRTDVKQWLSHSFDLFMSVDRRCSVPVRDDFEGRQYVRMEMHGPWKEEKTDD